VTSGAATEEDAVHRLLEFVQRSLFRDPVSQPLTAEGGVPDAGVILFSARGRCGHAARLVLELAQQAGLDARLLQLPAHVVAEVKVEDRWVLVDADTFKNGVIPVNRQGRLPTLEDLMTDPYQLDRYPPTGWYLRPNTRWTRGMLGEQVRGYVDALEPDERGFVSGYFVPAAQGFPPSLPRTVRLEVHRDCFHLQWSPSTVKHDTLLGYRVRVGTTSRGWTYEDFGADDAVLRSTPADVLSVQTPQTCVEGPIPPEARRLYASVTPVSSRIDKEPQTHFQPSEEVSCEV